MRAFVSILLTLLITAASWAGNYRYTFKNVPLSAALAQLGKEHPDLNIGFLYRDMAGLKVTADVDSDTPDGAISQIIAGLPVSCTYKNGCYYLQRKPVRRYHGRLVDESGAPVESASVIFVSERDSTSLGYAISDEEGEFVVECDCDSVMALISSISHARVAVHPKSCDMGRIVMNTLPVMIREAVVVGRRPSIKMQGSTMIVDIHNTPLGDMPSVDDILGRLPSVSAGDGSYSVFGKGVATLYINNRKVTDRGEIDRLRPADISSVEIIRNPGSEYDADIPAVIKIRLRKSAIDGVGVDAKLSAHAGRRLSDNEQVSVSYNSDPVSAFLTVAQNSIRRRSDQTNVQDIFCGDERWRIVSDMPGWKSRYRDISVTSGISVGIGERHNAGARITYNDNSQRNGGHTASDVSCDGSEYETLELGNVNPEGYRQWLGNIFYEGTLRDNLTLIANGDYVNRHAHLLDETEEAGSITPPHFVRTAAASKYDLWSGNVKLTWTPQDNLTFSFGIDGNTVVQSRSNFQSDPASEALLKTRDTRHAVFTQGSMTFGRMNIDMGMRYESSNMDYRDGKDNSTILDKTYSRFFPNITLASTVGNTYMSLGFSSRVSRPTFYQLRNSKEYFNRYEQTEGNPILRPTYTYDMSWSLQYTSFTANLGYQWIRDFITEETSVTEGYPPHILSRPVNKSMYTALYLGLNYNRTFGIWQPYLSANIMKTFYDIDRRSEIVPAPGNAPYIGLSFNNYFKIKETTFYIELKYNTTGTDCNEVTEENLNINCGIHRRFFNKSLYVALQASNLLASKARSITYYDSNTFDRTSYRDTRRVSLTLRYSFRHRNKYKGKVSAQDEIDRM